MLGSPQGQLQPTFVEQHGRQTSQKFKGSPYVFPLVQLPSQGTGQGPRWVCARADRPVLILVAGSWPPWPGVVLHLLNAGSPSILLSGARKV